MANDGTTMTAPAPSVNGPASTPKPAAKPVNRVAAVKPKPAAKAPAPAAKKAEAAPAAKTELKDVEVAYLKAVKAKGGVKVRGSAVEAVLGKKDISLGRARGAAGRLVESGHLSWLLEDPDKRVTEDLFTLTAKGRKAIEG